MRLPLSCSQGWLRREARHRKYYPQLKQLYPPNNNLLKQQMKIINHNSTKTNHKNLHPNPTKPYSPNCNNWPNCNPPTNPSFSSPTVPWPPSTPSTWNCSKLVKASVVASSDKSSNAGTFLLYLLKKYKNRRPLCVEKDLQVRHWWVQNGGATYDLVEYLETTQPSQHSQSVWLLYRRFSYLHINGIRPRSTLSKKTQMLLILMQSHHQTGPLSIKVLTLQEDHPPRHQALEHHPDSRKCSKNLWLRVGLPRWIKNEHPLWNSRLHITWNGQVILIHIEKRFVEPGGVDLWTDTWVCAV